MLSHLKSQIITYFLKYYDPKGIKIGELDISGCEVKKISNKDAKLSEKSTKYPFLLEG